MSYRDELGQAHQRIAQLEGQLREAREPRPEPKKRPFGWLLVLFPLLGILGGVLFGLSRRAAEPMRLAGVEEAVRRPADFSGKTMRVQGELVEKTTRRRTDHDRCTMSFVIERGGLRLPVELATCVVPDTYRDATGILIVAEGQLAEDGSVFHASQILVRWADTFPGMR